MRQICLDTETTGIDAAKGDRVIEIGCAEFAGRTLSDRDDHYYHVYINPERDVPEEASRIHGLTNAVLADKPVFADIVDGFLAFIRDSELIIHNAEFDVGFLDMELKRLGKGKLTDYGVRITDSLALAREKFPGLRNSLDALCTRYEIDSSARTLHGALLDARLLAEVYLAMTREQGSLLGDSYAEAETIEPLPSPDKLIVATIPEDELKEHEAFLEKINQKCKGICAWSALGNTASSSEKNAP